MSKTKQKFWDIMGSSHAGIVLPHSGFNSLTLVFFALLTIVFQPLSHGQSAENSGNSQTAPNSINSESGNAAAADTWLMQQGNEKTKDKKIEQMSPLKIVTTLSQSAANEPTNIGWQLRERLPEAENALQNANWATTNTLLFLNKAIEKAPGQVRALNIYLAAWYVWHHDENQGDEVLWNMGYQDELVAYYEAHGQWNKIRNITQDNQTVPATRVGALWALSKQAEKQKQEVEAKQFLLEAFKRCGLIGPSQRRNIWEAVRSKLSDDPTGSGNDISWAEYYRCLQQIVAQSADTECVAQAFFEMRKMSTLDPKLEDSLISQSTKEQQNSTK